MQSEARTLLRLNLLLFLAAILATRLGLVIHEVCGHGWVSLWLGATEVGYGFSPFGSGWAAPDFPPEVDLSMGECAAISAAGILVNLATGFVAWLFVERARAAALRASLLLFAGVSIFSALSYLIVGLCSGRGDPGDVLGYLSRGWVHETELWWTFLIPLALIAYWGARDFMAFLERYLHLGSARRRTLLSLATFGVFAGAVLVFAWLTYSKTDPASLGRPPVSAPRRFMAEGCLVATTILAGWVAVLSFRRAEEPRRYELPTWRSIGALALLTFLSVVVPLYFSEV